MILSHLAFDGSFSFTLAMYTFRSLAVPALFGLVVFRTLCTSWWLLAYCCFVAIALAVEALCDLALRHIPFSSVDSVFNDDSSFNAFVCFFRAVDVDDN